MALHNTLQLKINIMKITDRKNLNQLEHALVLTRTILM